MRQNPEFLLCDVAGNHVLMPAGRAAVSLNGMVTLNDTGICIWKKLERDMTFEELLAAILDEYEVSKETARGDLIRYLQILREVNAIIE